MDYEPGGGWLYAQRIATSMFVTVAGSYAGLFVLAKFHRERRIAYHTKRLLEKSLAGSGQ
jgi:hypothetical protein